LAALMLVGTRFAKGFCFLALPYHWLVGLLFTSDGRVCIYLVP